MATLMSLPSELQHHIFSYLDLWDCSSLRLTCQVFRAIGTHWVFREVELSTEEGSCDKVGNILADPELARCVSSFHFNLVSWFEMYELGKDDKEEDFDNLGGDIGFLPKGVYALLERLPDFPNVRRLRMSFQPHCAPTEDWVPWVPQTPVFRLGIMKKFLQSVMALPQLPRELALRNLQSIKLTDSEVVANLLQLLGTVRSLRLKIGNDQSMYEEEDVEKAEEAHHYFDQLPSFWLKPTMSNLQHLTLYQSIYFGFYPKLDLSGIHFPHLKSLALGAYTFVHDSQLEWILSHGSTLTQVYLDNCSIVYEAAVRKPENTLLDAALYAERGDLPGMKWWRYEKRWHHYFRAFQERLPHLRVFLFGSRRPCWSKKGDEAFELETTIEPSFGKHCYQMYYGVRDMSAWRHRMLYSGHEDGRGGYRQGDIVPASDEDKLAYVELCAKIDQRSKEEIKIDGWFV